MRTYGEYMKEIKDFHKKEDRLILCPKCKDKAHITKEESMFRIGCYTLHCDMVVYDFDLEDGINKWNNLPEEIKAEDQKKAFICIGLIFVILIFFISVSPHNDNIDREKINPYDYAAFNATQQIWYKEGYNNFEEYNEQRKKENRQEKYKKELGLWIDPETDIVYFKDFWLRKTPRYNKDGSIMHKDDLMK